MTQSNDLIVRVEIRHAEGGQPLQRYLGNGEYANSYLYHGSDLAGAAAWFDGFYEPRPGRTHAIVVNGRDITDGAHPLVIATGLRHAAAIRRGETFDATDGLRAYMDAVDITDPMTALDDLTEWLLKSGLAGGDEWEGWERSTPRHR